MRRILAVTLPLLTGCHDQTYSDATLSRSIAVDDGQNVEIAELKGEVAQLRQRDLQEASSRVKGDADLAKVVWALGNETEANQRLDDTRLNTLEHRAKP